MAQNDMEVIMYKILSYLYECMKAGKRPRMEDMCCSCQMFQIPLSYWGTIMEELTLTRGGNWSIVKQIKALFQNMHRRITTRL